MQILRSTLIVLNRLLSFDAALHQVCAPNLTQEGEYTFDRLADRPVSEKRPALRTHHTLSASSAHIEDSIREKIAGVPVFVKDVLTRLLGYARGSNEKSSHPGVLRDIQIIVEKDEAKTLYGSSLKTAVEQAPRNMVL